MIIKKNSKEIKRIIYKTEGYSKKERKVPLYTITIPSQAIIYSIDNSELIDRAVKINVMYHDPSANEPKINEGEWPLEIFTVFVNGVKAVTELAVPYIKEDPSLEAESEVTETTHVWSVFRSEKVAGGIFAKEEYESFQKVYFRILGLDSFFVRWEPDMLNPIIELRDEFIKQREDFKQQIIRIKNKNKKT